MAERTVIGRGAAVPGGGTRLGTVATVLTATLLLASCAPRRIEPIPLLVVMPRRVGCGPIAGADCIACDAFRCDGAAACWCDDAGSTEQAR